MLLAFINDCNRFHFAKNKNPKIHTMKQTLGVTTFSISQYFFDRQTHFFSSDNRVFSLKCIHVY